MARIPTPEAAAVYSAAEAVIRSGLEQDDSLFTPGRPVWTAKNFGTLGRSFVDRPDLTSGKSFLTKLEEQIAGEDTDAIQLMAELLYLHLIITVAIGGDRKREIIRAVLGWTKRPIELPDQLSNALDRGLVDPGTFFNTNRDLQVAFLIRFGLAWKRLTADARRRFLTDPWDFKELVMSIEVNSAYTQQLALLHLIHPDTFEAITSREHKGRIVEVFARYVTTPSEDIDRRLLQVREGLAGKYGQDFEMYGSKLSALWRDPPRRWDELVKWGKMFQALPNFEDEERSYKLRVHDAFEEARAQFLANRDTWPASLKKAFQHKDNNLTRWQAHDRFLKWVSANPDKGREAIGIIWGAGDPDTDRVERFLEHVPGSAVKSPGARLSIASIMLMGIDPAHFPIYRTRPFKTAFGLTGEPHDTSRKVTERQRYNAVLGFLDQFIEESAARGLVLKDRLDAQSVIWAISSSPPPESWPPEIRSEFLAFRDSTSVTDDTEDGEEPPRNWLLAAGANGEAWDDFIANGIVAVEWDELGDFLRYETREELQAAIKSVYSKEREPTNDGLACFQFAREMKPGDTVYVKRGLRTVLGKCRVTGDYEYDSSRPRYRSIRRVEWLDTSPYDLRESSQLTLKTLTDITPFPGFPENVRADATTQTSPPPVGEVLREPYTVDDVMEDAFVGRQVVERIITTLERRKNVILQGPPGVGKSFLARRLAYALIGARAGDNVEMIQFHQSYAYEDFVQGWRPNGERGFTLRNGPFHQFCERARLRPDQAFVFIIDEINRGNLSKIFGELMLLIESDKRGPDYGVPLTYAHEGAAKFFVPPNVHLIGLMNTADRSLAMVDYALRRRFAFIGLEPAFESPAYTRHAKLNGLSDSQVARIVRNVTAVNKMIREDSKNLGPGFVIGHSYFSPTTSVSGPDAWYESIVNDEIVPLLEEYWFDDSERVEECIRMLKS